MRGGPILVYQPQACGSLEFWMLPINSALSSSIQAKGHHSVVYVSWWENKRQLQHFRHCIHNAWWSKTPQGAFKKVRTNIDKTKKQCSAGGISCKVYSTFRTSYMFTGRTLKSPVYRCRMILPKRNKIRAKNRTITRCLLYDVSFEGAEHSCPLSTAHPGRQLLPVRLQQRTRSLLLITRTNQLYSSISPVGPDCSQSPARSATPGPELPPALHSSRL